MSTPPVGPMQLPATWSAIAPGYAEEAAGFFAEYAEEALRLVPPAASAHVLDVAAGPGTLAFLAAPRTARVTAVDFAPGMVEQIQARAAKAGITNVHSAVMDAQALDLPSESVDAVYCLFAFMFFPSRERAFAEMKRVLKPGGRALFATWAPIERRPFMKLGFDSLAEALPDLPPMSKGDLQQPGECIGEMTAAGFSHVSASSFSAAARIDSAERYVELMERAGAPFAALRKRLGDEAWAQAHARLLDAVRRRLPEGGADLSAEAIFTSGTR